MGCSAIFPFLASSITHVEIENIHFRIIIDIKSGSYM